MINGIKYKRIWVYREEVDFRKQINGLVGLISEEMGEQATSGDVYVFRNRERNRIKVVVWDRNGFWMGYKRLEKGRFDMPKEREDVVIDREQYEMLISGMPVVQYGVGRTEKMIMT